MRLRCCLLLSLMSPLALGADLPSLSLDAAVETALRQAPQVAGGIAGVEAAQSLAVNAGRLPDPALVVGIDNLPVKGPEAYSTTRDFMTMRKVGVMQEFPRSEKRQLQHQRAEAQADLAGAELTRTRLDVARETAQAWIRLATMRGSLEQLRTLQSEVELGAASARAALAAGRGSGADALSAEVAVARLKNRLLKTQSEVQRAQAELARWIGDAAAEPLAPMPALSQLPVPAETLLTTAHLHGDLLPFEARLSAARMDVDLARAERRPDWSAELSFAKRGPDFSDMASLQFTVGLPLFAKYRQNPVIEARSATRRQLEAERESETRMHTAELQQKVLEWRNLGEQLNQYDHELLPLARERSQLTLASYRAGTSELRLSLEAFTDEIDLLGEQSELQNTRGQAWAFLRYLEAEHVHATQEALP